MAVYLLGCESDGWAEGQQAAYDVFCASGFVEVEGGAEGPTYAEFNALVETVETLQEQLNGLEPGEGGTSSGFFGLPDLSIEDATAIGAAIVTVWLTVWAAVVIHNILTKRS